MSNITLPTSERLKNGARLLGSLWRSKQRCLNGWSGLCGCQKKTRFCQAKAQWCQLKGTMPDWEPPNSSDPYAVVEVMSIAEFEETGMTLAIEIPNLGTYKVGPKGSIKFKELMLLVTNPDNVSRVFRVIDSFPGSAVVSVDKPKIEEVAKP